VWPIAAEPAMVLGKCLNGACHRLDCRRGNNSSAMVRRNAYPTTVSPQMGTCKSPTDVGGKECFQISGRNWAEFSTISHLNIHSEPLMPRSRTLAAILSSFVLACQIPVGAQSAVDPDINKEIRQEENDHSQIMHTMHFLTDIYGPRLTGSPNHKAAADWAISQM
jgi:hypothetical protein